jgi:copper chaperone CopZ
MSMPHFRLIPHRLFTEPKARVDRVSSGAACDAATVHVDGLLCSACAASVKSAIEALPGVRNVVVDLDRAEAIVEYDAERAQPAAFVAAVEGAVILRPFRRFLAAVSGHLPRRSSA